MKVIVTDPPIVRLADELRSGAPPTAEWTFAPEADEQELVGLIATAEVYVGAAMSERTARAGASLRLVQVTGAGCDGVALAALPPHVAVANVYRHGRSLAEHVLMAMLALSRNLLASDRELRRGRWLRPLPGGDPHEHEALRGKTVGIVGLGAIGRELTTLAAALEMTVVAVRRQPSPAGADGVPPGIAWCGGPDALPELLRAADFVVLATPLNDETRGLIGARELSAMRPSAYLINVARAHVVDEAALYEALAARAIAGAAIDVWWGEGDVTGPRLGTHPFGQLDNVILTPHCAGSTNETFTLRARDIAENVKRLSEGRPLLNLVRAAGRR